MKMKNINEACLKESPEGVVRATLAYNDEAMLCHFTLKKGAHIPLHSHRATQIGYIVKGNLRFLSDSPEKAFEAKTGDSYVFSAHVEHGAVAIEDSQYVEVFVPVREEYKDF